MSTPSRVAACLTALLLAASCTPTVNVATEKPIEININVNHEVRIKVEKDVEGLLSSEGQAKQGVAPRGLDEDLQKVWADAVEVAAAKEGGLIGEQADGYVGLVKPGGAKLQALTESANAGRLRFYQKLAGRYQVPVVEVAKLAGAYRLRDAEIGDWVRPPKGAWVRKDETLKIQIKG